MHTHTLSHTHKHTQGQTKHAAIPHCLSYAPHHTWSKLFGECVPHDAQLAFLCAVRRSPAFDPLQSCLPESWITFLIGKIGRDKAFSLPDLAAMPREFIDSVEALSRKSKSMPDVLPPEAELVRMSEAEIEERVAAYVGTDVDALHAILCAFTSCVA